MNRTTIINYLLSLTKQKRYLEIGTYDAGNYEKIVASVKQGVDPAPAKNWAGSCIVTETSDEYFQRDIHKFDVIFIDGLHESSQVARDIANACAHLSDDGYIVLHDLNPQSEQAQLPTYSGGQWNGDCWRAFAAFRASVPGYQSMVVDVDQGCGIISRAKGKHPPELLKDYNFSTLSYDDFAKQRKTILNLIDWKEFIRVLAHALTPDQVLDFKLRAYIGDPDNDENNYALACHYQDMKQNASAVSFFIRAAERSTNKLLQYECMVSAALCFMEQGTRGLSVRGLLHRAMTILPTRPEAYFLLSRWWEREKQIESWVNGYSYACMAEQLCDFDSPPLRRDVEYPGKYGILFEKAVCGWWVGQCEESRDIFKKLYKNYKLDQTHYEAVKNNLKFMSDLTGRDLFNE